MLQPTRLSSLLPRRLPRRLFARFQNLGIFQATPQAIAPASNQTADQAKILYRQVERKNNVGYDPFGAILFSIESGRLPVPAQPMQSISDDPPDNKGTAETQITKHCNDEGDDDEDDDEDDDKYVDCASCGVSTLRYFMDTDHKKPRMFGGSNCEDNLQQICLRCHRSKTLYEQKVLLPFRRALQKKVDELVRDGVVGLPSCSNIVDQVMVTLVPDFQIKKALKYFEQLPAIKRSKGNNTSKNKKRRRLSKKKTPPIKPAVAAAAAAPKSLHSTPQSSSVDTFASSFSGAPTDTFTNAAGPLGDGDVGDV
jgi:hypothetical protein